MASPRASHLLEIVKDSPAGMPLIYKPTNPEPTSPTISFAGLLHSGPLFFCPQYSRTRHQTTQDNSYSPKELLKLFKLANPKSAYLDSPVPSYGNHDKGPRPCFPLLLLPVDPFWGFSMWPWMLGVPCLLFPGNCRYKLLPSWHFHVCMF